MTFFKRALIGLLIATGFGSLAVGAFAGSDLTVPAMGPEAIRDDAPPTQQATVEDLQVSTAEFIAAADRTARCIELAGGILDSYRLSVDYARAGFSAHSGDPGVDIETIVDRCYEAHLSHVSALRAVNVMEAGLVDLDEWAREIGGCLAAAGFSTASVESPEALVQSLDLQDSHTNDTFTKCRALAENYIEMSR